MSSPSQWLDAMGAKFRSKGWVRPHLVIEREKVNLLKEMVETQAGRWHEKGMCGVGEGPVRRQNSLGWVCIGER